MAGPLYRQIADELRRQIEAGVLGEGARVPTEDELMAADHASRNTVRGALKELATRGLVYTLHGKGTFVAERVSPIVTTLTTDPRTGRGGGEGLVYTTEVAASGRSASAEEPTVSVPGRPESSSLVLLGIAEDTEVITRYEKRYIDGLPWSLQTSFYPRILLSQAPRLLDTGDIREGRSPTCQNVGSSRPDTRMQ